jgi:uncharacterized protein YdaU (DUF1376 family)
MDLLCFQWEDGFIPDDLGQLARMLGVSTAELRKVWGEIETQFPVTEPGHRQNSRVASDRAATLDKVSKRAEAGKQGGRPKKAKPEPEDPEKESKPKAIALQTESKTEPIPEPYITETKVSGAEAPTPPVLNDPFSRAMRVMRVVCASLDGKEPRPVDVRPQLKEDSPIQVLIAEYGETGAADLFLFAYHHWEGTKPTWRSVCAQRNQLFEQMNASRSGLVLVAGGRKEAV